MRKLMMGALLMASATSAYSAGDAKKGKALYAVCSSCHGADGMGVKAQNAPRLAGMSDWYLKRQIDNFKKGIRGTHKGDTYGALMRPMAMTLASDQAVDDVVAYILTLGKK